MSRQISVYIHIPYCLSKCEYCDFYSIPSKTKVPDCYVNALCTELEYRVKQFDFSELKTLYIGGGTPSLLSASQLKLLTSRVFSLLPPAENLEFTVELNPDDVNEELLDSLRNCKVTRISLGLQSMSDDVLSKAGRRAGVKENINALEKIKASWEGELSVDLISALPYETQASQLNALEQVIKYNPQHISYYSLTVEEETTLGQKIYGNKLEYDYENADKLWLLGRDFLIKKGWKQYEVSNFCKDGFECRHNMTYWSRGSYIGIGSGGCGTVYKGKTAYRWTNKPEVGEYIKYWNGGQGEGKIIPQTVEELDAGQCEFEFFMMCLRVREGFSEKDYFNAFGKELPPSAKSLFQKWKEKGLSSVENKENTTFYSLTEKGLLFLNRFLEELEL